MKKLLNVKSVFKLLFSVFFVGVVLFVFITAYKPYVQENLLKQNVSVSDSAETGTKQTKFDGKKLYPFKEQKKTDKKEEEKPQETKKKRSFLDRVRRKIARVKKAMDEKSAVIFDKESELETYITEEYDYDMNAVLTTKYFEKLVGFNATTSANRFKNSKRLSTDIVVELDDGIYSYIVDDANVNAQAKSVAAFSKYLNERDTDFLLFVIPPKASDSLINKKYRGTYHDASDKVEQRIYDILDPKGVQHYSMADYVNKHYPDDRLSLYFKTDHHWLPQAALLGDQLLAQELNTRFDYQIDTSVFDLKNYTVTETEPLYFGTHGRKVTEAYADTESIPLVVPNYNSHLEVFRSRTNQTYEGTIQETLMDPSALEFGDKTKYDVVGYNYYGYGNMGLLQIHNLDKQDGKRVLLIRTSFGSAMAPYVCHLAEYVDMVDLRHFGGSLKTYIAETKPDTVVLTYCLTSFESAGFEGGLYENTFNFE